MNLVKKLEEHEIVTNNYLPTKKEVQKSAVTFVQKLLDDGDYQREEVLAQAVRLSEGLNTIVDELKKSIPEEGFEMYGMKATFTNGGETCNYNEDPVWADLKQKLKDREELLKPIAKAEGKKIGYDENKKLLPKVSLNYKKSSLKITY